MSLTRRTALKQLTLAAAGSIAARLVRAGIDVSDIHAAGGRSVLNEAQRALVAQAAELIIPETDTPGAGKAGVPQFIVQIVSNWYTPHERGIFLAGLAQLEDYGRQHYARPFSECSTEEQIAALSAAEATALAYQSAHANPSMGIQDEPDAEAPFFYKLKELTVLGYYTSEIGSTTELRYEPVPGRYSGDIDFDRIGHQWSR